MPWKIVRSRYDPTDPTILHDDELVAVERALSANLGPVQNEYSPAWRALQKVAPLARTCTGENDPVHLLPPGAAAPLPDPGDIGAPSQSPPAPRPRLV